jgi:Rho-binding antiterminator
MAKGSNKTRLKMISCQTHDYIEIACLYGFQIRLQLTDGSTLQGKAITTETSSDKREWLILQQSTGKIQIDLMQIKSMQSLTPNSHFEQINF